MRQLTPIVAGLAHKKDMSENEFLFCAIFDKAIEGDRKAAAAYTRPLALRVSL